MASASLGVVASLLAVLGCACVRSHVPLNAPLLDLTSRGEVTTLPGYDGAFGSKHHGGYLTVDKRLQNHLFYYFVESEGSPADDPLVLWLNGGPCCSSFDGFVYEHGPFNFDYNDGDIRLERNPYTWAKVANVLYLDSPAGTGLSYSTGIGSYVTTDDKTTSDLHAAVLKFMELFPEFASHRFFVSGESYAGIYVPLLVKKIVEGNRQGTAPPVNITVKYWPDVTFPKYGDALMPFAYGKSLIPKQTFDDINEACDGTYWNATSGSTCLYLQQLARYAWLSEPLNLYNVAGKCDMPPTGYDNGDRRAWHGRVKEFVEENGLVWPVGHVRSTGRVHNWNSASTFEPPCTDYWSTLHRALRRGCVAVRTVETWLNSEDVRQAIHAAPVNVSGPFYLCTDEVLYYKTVPSVLQLHRQLVTEDGMHALIFSGDHDMAVPHTGTERWTASLDLEVLSPWSMWFDREGQVGGYRVEYRNLTYCTVRNAGHMVPQTHPPQGLEMFRRYLDTLTMEDPLLPLPA